MLENPSENEVIALDDLFERANDVVATSVIGRPRQGSGYVPKIDAKIRLNREVMDWLKSKGPRHYSRINGCVLLSLSFHQCS